MRRTLLSLTAVAVLAATPPLTPPVEAAARPPVDCTEFCGEKAAESCQRIDSLWCALFIFGCLAGCNLS